MTFMMSGFNDFKSSLFRQITDSQLMIFRSR